MSAMRQLPQRPGQTPTPTPPSDGDRPFVYPPYAGHPPPFDRHRSYPSPYITHPPPQHEHGTRPYFHPPPDMTQHPYPNENGHGHGHGHGQGQGYVPGSGDSGKKRPRELSISDREDKASPRRQSTSKSVRHESNASEQRPNAPSVLIREKKQKACSNCRRAKLKCIVNDGESECVRCTSRSERCVFFPRSHDEDWQQTITQDVYSAMSHLTSISSAVSHMVNHLVAHNVIPPLPSREFPHGVLPNYEMPDRDMTVLQGWNAEKNREDDSRKKGKRKGNRQDNTDPDDDDDDVGPMGPSNGNHWAHVGQPPTHNQGYAPNYPHPLQSHPSFHPAMMHQLPPYRAPGHPGQVQLTPTSELDLPRRQMQYPLPPLAPSPSASGGMHPPQSAQSLPQIPGHQVINHSPGLSLPNATPNSMNASSISPAANGNGLPPPPNDALSVIIHPEVDIDILAEAKTSPPQPVPMYDEAGNIIIGSADGRNNIIKQGLISPQDATLLVDHFHTHMAPFLFGYLLESHRFPYLSDGPPSITPFILSVLSLLSSERLPAFNRYKAPLTNYVEMLVHTSPAESWQNIATSRLEHNTDDTRDVLDPELGIGPEEIVAACILASYMQDDQAQQRAYIAESAFKWARGWIKLLTGGPRWTFAENLGIVPEERKADWRDMSRIWLLCYVVEITHQHETDKAAVPDVYDPTFYCLQLIKPDDPPEQVSHYDVILVHRAKLVAIIRRWYYRSVNLWKMGPNASFDLERLATSTNDRLDGWQQSFAKYRPHMTRDESRQLIMFYDFVRVLSNSFAVDKLQPTGMDQEPTRRACLDKAITAGLEFLGLVVEYTPKQLANMPTYDLKLITTVLEFLVQACGTGHGYDVESSNGLRPLQTSQVRPRVNELVLKFDSKRHNETGPTYLMTGDTVRNIVIQLEDVCTSGLQRLTPPIGGY